MRRGGSSAGQLKAYAAILAHTFPGSAALDAALGLLRAPAIDPEAADLDSHLRQARRHVDAVQRALSELDGLGLLSLQSAFDRPGVALPAGKRRSALTDAITTRVMASLRRRPAEAADLAVATGRLVEESRALLAANRRTVPLGRGFEDRLERRLRLRIAVLADHALIDALEQHRRLLLEAPDEGRAAVERGVGRPLSDSELTWLEAERFAGMLEVARVNAKKTEGGQIRWFLRRDPVHGVVLDRYGVHGHWLVAGDLDPRSLARLGTVAARITGEDRPGSPTGWRALVVETGRPPRTSATEVEAPVVLDETLRLALDDLDDDRSRSAIRQRLTAMRRHDARTAIATAMNAPRRLAPEPRRRSFALTTNDGVLELASGSQDREPPLAAAPVHADDDALLDFLDVVGRVAEAATITDRVDRCHDDSAAVTWTRALLARLPMGSASAECDDLTGLNVRLVYITAAHDHPLGGLPTIGLSFVADHLERAGARADIVTMPARDMDRRLVELLGADVLGLSVYVTNRDEVAQLVTLLRDEGFRGRIVLGGPDLREVDLIQQAIPGCDALIRGEGEEVLPDVLRALRHLDAGATDHGLALARALRGVVIAHGDVVMLADTAARNAARKISCPLPFEWQRHARGRTLHANFTRGCPYACGFCPNHQGQKYHSCEAREMWAFAELAAADAMRLPRAEDERCAAAVQDELGISGPPRLRPALNVLLRGPVPRELLGRWSAARAEPDGAARVADEGSARSYVSPRDAKVAWLRTKAALLPDVEVDVGPAAVGRDRATLESFELMTSEDNTLVNADVVMELLDIRRRSGLARAIVFNPGQNTVRDLTDHKGNVNTAYVDALSDANPFKIVLGVDGTSNPVLRENHKPYYSIGEAIAVNAALARRGVEVLNNYILITPETDLLEAIEAFALFVVLPVRWRDHGASINLRIVKEPGTRSHDEGLLFAPEDAAYDDPLRFPEVEALLSRWDLTSSVRSADLPELLWRILAEDQDAKRLLPLVVRRWERDFDDDASLVALAARIRIASQPDMSLVESVRHVARALEAEWLADPRRPAGTRSDSADVPDPPRQPTRRRSKRAVRGGLRMPSAADS